MLGQVLGQVGFMCIFMIINLIVIDMETYRPVIGNENYLVSQKGKVISLYSGKTLKYSKSAGYYSVGLYSDNGVKRRTVHSLVAEVWIGERPDGYECNHKDGNKLNNNVDNLEWVTRSENGLHAYRTGLSKPNLTMLGKKMPQGTKDKISASLTGKSKTKEHVEKVRAALKIKVTCPYCEKEGGKGGMSRHHFNNCKYKT